MPEGILMARHGNRLRTIAPLFASHFLPSAKKRKQNVRLEPQLKWTTCRCEQLFRRIGKVLHKFGAPNLPDGKSVATFCCIAGYAGNRTKRARFVHAPERFAVLVAPHFCAAKIGWQKVGGLQARVVDWKWGGAARGCALGKVENSVLLGDAHLLPLHRLLARLHLFHCHGRLDAVSALPVCRGGAVHLCIFNLNQFLGNVFLKHHQVLGVYPAWVENMLEKRELSAILPPH
jgi:hypothetical protein